MTVPATGRIQRPAALNAAALSEVSVNRANTRNPNAGKTN
jgi:hypothetical protein